MIRLGQIIGCFCQLLNCFDDTPVGIELLIGFISLTLTQLLHLVVNNITLLFECLPGFLVFAAPGDTNLLPPGLKGFKTGQVFCYGRGFSKRFSLITQALF